MYLAAAAALSRLIFSFSNERTVVSHCRREKRGRGGGVGGGRGVGGWVGAEGWRGGVLLVHTRAQHSHASRWPPHLHASRVELLHHVPAQHLQLHALDL
jgi:hypothetical protein